MALFGGSKSQWDQWGPEGHRLVAQMMGVFREVDMFVTTGVVPEPSVVADSARKLADLDQRRLDYQNQWSRLASQDNRSGGAYTILSLAAFMIHQATQLLWASHVIAVLGAEGQKGTAADAAEFARGIAKAAAGNADGVVSHGGKCSPKEGAKWLEAHFPLVTSSPLLNSGLALGKQLGGMPPEWTVPSFD